MLYGILQQLPGHLVMSCLPAHTTKQHPCATYNSRHHQPSTATASNTLPYSCLHPPRSSPINNKPNLACHASPLPGHHAVAVVCGDTVASAPTEEFLARANSACRPLSDPCNGGEAAADEVPSPVIPHLYDRVAQWQMEQFGVTREQLVGDG
jgi:hypothetical protein